MAGGGGGGAGYLLAQEWAALMLSVALAVVRKFMVTELQWHTLYRLFNGCQNLVIARSAIRLDCNIPAAGYKSQYRLATRPSRFALGSGFARLSISMINERFSVRHIIVRRTLMGP